MEPVKIGIIGAGAVTELFHLPAAQLCPEAQIVALVDKNSERGRALADRFSVPHVMTTHRDLYGHVDGVINALPNYLHASVTIEFLERGVPVLVEKPLAVTLAEAEKVTEVAKTTAVPLQVGHLYRFCNGVRFVKQAIDEGWLGSLQGFSLEFGFVWSWPMVSGSLSKEQAGGGALLDFGSHMLDLLLQWFGSAIEVQYWDDSLGGVEADCSLSLVLQGPAGPVPGTVALSRLRNLSNSAVVIGKHFTVEYDITTADKVRYWPSASNKKAVSSISNFGLPSPQPWDDVCAQQLRAFARAISGRDPSAVPGESVLDTVALIDRCYRERQPLELPWEKPVTLNKRRPAKA